MEKSCRHPEGGGGGGVGRDEGESQQASRAGLAGVGRGGYGTNYFLFQRNDRFFQRIDNYFQKAQKQQEFSEE